MKLAALAIIIVAGCSKDPHSAETATIGSEAQAESHERALETALNVPKDFPSFIQAAYPGTEWTDDKCKTRQSCTFKTSVEHGAWDKATEFTVGRVSGTAKFGKHKATFDLVYERQGALWVCNNARSSTSFVDAQDGDACAVISLFCSGNQVLDFKRCP
jgi:hypothetical protein